MGDVAALEALAALSPVVLDQFVIPRITCALSRSPSNRLAVSGPSIPSKAMVIGP
jgi:hypothetical protein